MSAILGFLVMCVGLWLFVDAATTPGVDFAQGVLAGYLIFTPYWIAAMTARRERS